MENENLNPIDPAEVCEENADVTEEAIEEVLADEECTEELEALDGVSASDNLLRKCEQVKDRCIDLAKSGASATKKGVLVATDCCVNLAKNGAKGAKKGVLVATDCCVNLAKNGAKGAKKGVLVATDCCVNLAKSGAKGAKKGVLVATDCCVGLAKSGASATKKGVLVATDCCVGLAKSGASATKKGVLVATDRCVSGAKTVAAKAKVLKTNPKFKQTRTYKLEMLSENENGEPIDSIEICDEKQFSTRSLIIASAAVVAVTATVAGIIIATTLDD